MSSPSQPEDRDQPSDALDQLHEALTEVKSHLAQHAQERQQILGQIETMQKDLMEQREVAAKAGERDTYNRLSEELAKLTRAYRVASEDPDADPMERYQWTDEEPKDAGPGDKMKADQPQSEDDDAETPSALRGTDPED